MPSPAAIGIIGALIGVASPIIAPLVPDFRWWFVALLAQALFVIAAFWIVGAAVDAEAAKPKESLDVLLGYAINAWMVIIGTVIFALSFAVRGFLLLRRRRAIRINAGVAT